MLVILESPSTMDRASLIQSAIEAPYAGKSPLYESDGRLTTVDSCLIESDRGVTCREQPSVGWTR